MGKPAEVPPSQRAATRALALAVIDSVERDAEMAHGLEVVPVHGAGHHFNRSDVEDLIMQLAQEIAAQQRSITYWKDGARIVESCLAQAIKADPQDAPFPLVDAEARRWFQAQADAYRHALEMMGPTDEETP